MWCYDDFSCCVSGVLFAGSSVNTSRAAFSILPSSSALIKASSSIIPPLATLMICKLGFALLKKSSFTSPLVFGVRGYAL